MKQTQINANNVSMTIVIIITCDTLSEWEKQKKCKWNVRMKKNAKKYEKPVHRYMPPEYLIKLFQLILSFTTY